MAESAPMPDFEVSPPVMARRPKPLGASTRFVLELLHVIAWCITIIGPYVHEANVQMRTIIIETKHAEKLPLDDFEKQPAPPLSWAVILVGPFAFAMRLLVMKAAELAAETKLLRELTAEQMQYWKDRGSVRGPP